MAGNKEITQLPLIPDANGSSLYGVKTGTDYQIPVGGNSGLAYTDGTGKVPVALIPSLPASQITSGTFANAQIAAGNVTQHQAALSIAWGQLTSVPAFATRWADWTEVTNKPATFTPSAHTHAAADITSGVFSTARLGTGVANTTVFLRGDGTWAGTPAAGSPAWGDITGTLSNQTDLQTALNGKAAASHTHNIADVTNLQSSLDSKANLSGATFTGAVSATTLRGRLVATTSNASITLGTTHLNTVVEKSDTLAYTYTLPVTFAAFGDVITVLNSGTAGNVTIARQGGVDLYKGATNGDITVTPGTSVNLYRSANDNRWLAI